MHWLCRYSCILVSILFPCRVWTYSQPLPDSPLRNFQVSQPLRYPGTECEGEIVLVHYTFSNSFGQPAIVQYEPPDHCGTPGSWAAIGLNFTGTSNGTQFDRLANVYLAGVEIWRTSTPEPTPDGIIWTALKDVSKYTPLFAKKGILVLDLGNLLDEADGLNGEYEVTLTAQFFASNAKHPRAVTPDVILPLSSNSRTQGSAFSVPPAANTTISVLPRNIAEAFVEIFASGNSDEEFWYGNVPDEFFSQLPPWNAPDGLANPKGPFREVQLLIDGLLAGVIFPYPVIYSGEFLPSILRPMLSYGAFDSPSYYIDITPFVPGLCDGRSHNFTLSVVGMGTNFSINQNWIVSGNLQLVLDDSQEATKGEIIIHDAPAFVIPSVVGTVAGPAPNVSVTSTTKRTIYIEGRLETGSGKISTVVWHQQLNFTNTEEYTTTLKNVSRQHVTQVSSGLSVSTHNGIVTISDSFTYPFALHLNYSVLPSPPGQTFFDYGVALQHSYDRAFSLGSALGGLETRIDTVQTCQGTEFEHQPNVTIRTGQTSQQFSYKDDNANTYVRDVQVATFVNITTGMATASNSSLVHDHQAGSLAV
ncbi:hypothetical protein K439DRAFT_257490 [Ramaria rubella]|nr:hypothetical protein K439DRAFT_257490 [Ramaria rubella]